MIEISYLQMLLTISAIWVAVRIFFGIRNKKVQLKRELQLLLVYICIVVVVRFTFCPFGLVDGQIQPLVFDIEKVFPMWVFV